LTPPSFKLKVGQTIFVPSGELPPPPIPDLFKDYFANPLSHPSCKGYAFMRGITSYHSGVDLAKGGGCPIRAVAAGTVTLAGWYNGGGNSVIIDHGGGIKSYYYHGSGQFWVKKGDYVRQGQNIMYMGCTGNCTGTHLHLSVSKNGALVDPSKVIPY
jgi:murein DD-endopeptidase MepM/ murein hydrolase activator NlpD